MEERRYGQSPLKKGEGCLFCQIISGKAESYPVFDDKDTFAFLDTSPVLFGHILLIPKKHYRYIAEIPDKTVGLLFCNAKLLARALEDALDADGTLIAINDKVSQSKPHLHIHVIPRKFGDGFRGTFWPRYRYHSKEDIIKMQEKIKEALKSIK